MTKHQTSAHQNVLLGLPDTHESRKATPIASGVLDYFPAAVAAVAKVSLVSNDKHNPGEPLHWSRDKSTDHADALVRHLLARGTTDADGLLHSAKVAWRALALLQTEIEQAAGFNPNAATEPDAIQARESFLEARPTERGIQLQQIGNA
jgi:hypothetical protein